jgi:hypothetical protein
MYTFNMPPKTKIDFSDAYQDRSKKTLEDVLESAFAIVEAADPNAFNSRHLANESGYALGTLSKRLGPIENVFIWAIEKSRDKKLQVGINFIVQFDPNSSVQEFAENFVDIFFKGIGTTGPKVIRYYESKLLKRDGYTTDSFDFSNIMVEPYLKMVSLNKTNTFRKMSRDEARMMCRLVQPLIERPFVHNDPIAGSQNHRTIAIEGIVRLFGK